MVVQRRMDIPTGIAEVMVPDTWAALFALARHVLDRVQPLVVAVTGSNGKTSTKEMVAAILARHFKVHRTQGNLNTETGLPLTLLSLELDHTALVLEMGMQQPGDIGRLAALAKPSVGIITNVGVVPWPGGHSTVLLPPPARYAVTCPTACCGLDAAFGVDSVSSVHAGPFDGAELVLQLWPTPRPWAIPLQRSSRF